MAEIETGDVKQAAGGVKLQLVRAIPVLVVLGLLVHFVLPRLGTIQESFQTLRRMLPWALAAAVLSECFSYVANGMVLRAVVALAGERLRLRRARALEMAGSTLALLPAGAPRFGAAVSPWSGARAGSHHTT